MRRGWPPWRHRHHHHPWHGPWGLWAHMDPQVREKILAEARGAYAQGFDGRHPWDRVFKEFVGRRPGWHQRIRWELRLHYGAHLHRRLFLWFGAAIFLSVVTTLCAAHFGHLRQGTHPVRALFLLGLPAVVLWVAAGKVARRIARPLYHMTRAAQDLGGGNLKARVATDDLGFDEMGVLSHAFNDMAARLERQRADERELLAAVSHELRTPLARIRLLVEIGRQRSQDGPAAAGRDRARGDRDRRAGRASCWPARGSSFRPSRRSRWTRSRSRGARSSGRASRPTSSRRRRRRSRSTRIRRCSRARWPTSSTTRASTAAVCNGWPSRATKRGSRSRSPTAARASRPATRFACSIAFTAAPAAATRTARWASASRWSSASPTRTAAASRRRISRAAARDSCSSCRTPTRHV